MILEWVGAAATVGPSAFAFMKWGASSWAANWPWLMPLTAIGVAMLAAGIVLSRRDARQGEEPLSQEEQDALSRMFAERIGDRKCPVCGHDAWVQARHLLYSHVWINGSFRRSKERTPFAVWFCHRCSYSLFFNVLMMSPPVQSLARVVRVQTNPPPPPQPTEAQ